jgi:glutamyl-tRNA synthetase
MDPASKVVGRLAPSPTGYLHLGHARSFLLAYWSARQKGGRLLVRLEDLDRERSTQHYVDETLRDLEWLGLDWDGIARRQSLGLERIREVAEGLALRGHAYPCICTKGDLRADLNAPQEGSPELCYTGRCRGRFASMQAARAATGRQPALRYRVPELTITVNDEFTGSRRFMVASECGDFVIVRKDLIPSYQLAVVVDDAADGVTEVVRGDDLLPSAARQQLLQADLGFQTPRWIHVPLVVDEQGRRFAKRADDLSLNTLRARGVDPRAVVAWVASNSGFAALDRATAKELCLGFDWSKVPRRPVVFTSRALTEMLAQAQ